MNSSIFNFKFSNCLVFIVLVFRIYILKLSMGEIIIVFMRKW